MNLFYAFICISLVWDTAGQERYHSLAPMYYRGAQAAIVVYDIQNQDSFQRAKTWVKELQRQVIICGICTHCISTSHFFYNEMESFTNSIIFFGFTYITGSYNHFAPFQRLHQIS